MRRFGFLSCRGTDGSRARRAVCRALMVGAAVIPHVTAAQQEAYFEVLTVPPANVGTCLPPLLKAAPGATVQQGQRLVIKSLQPGNSREISTMSDGKGSMVLYSDRTSITRQTVRTEGASITAILHPGGEITGSRIETVLTVPDSIVRMQDIVAIQRVIDASSSTMERRALDSAEQLRVGSMLEFIRKRCP